MDPTQRTSGALLDRANADIAQLLRRFENIIALAPIDKTTTPTPTPSLTTTAINAYHLEVETAALVRSAEDILTLTRSLKEAWLFGKLATVGTSEAEERAARSAAVVEGGLRRLIAGDGGERGEGVRE